MDRRRHQSAPDLVEVREGGVFFRKAGFEPFITLVFVSGEFLAVLADICGAAFFHDWRFIADFRGEL